MPDLEKLSAVAMEIITYSGAAKSTYIQAMHLAKKQQVEEAHAKLEEGDNFLKEAHDKHLALLQKEATDNEPQVSMLVLHAEDQFMSCETIKIMVQEFMELYKERN
ncbi:PTS lactose/cellobiose transporter subunit IIA [Amedibacillus sp. YH-ame10]